MADMRAKMVVTRVDDFGGGQQRLFLQAVAKNSYPEDGTDENNTFAKWTPTAALELLITNPALTNRFAAGQEFYLDFTAV